MKGSILEENIARTIGSIGESIAAGAIFTIPAFVIAGAWTNFNTFDAYIKSTALMFVGGLLGILFVTFLRRVMVTDPDLVFPESVAAAEIHKAGQKGSQGSKFLFQAMGFGALLYSLGVVQLFAASKDFILKVGKIGSSFVRLGAATDSPTIGAGGTVAVSGPGIFPAYIGVGYIIGPRLAALNFAGGVLAWGLFAPLLMFFLGPQLIPTLLRAGGRRGRRQLARHGHQRLEVHHPADRRRRHARRRRLHPLQDAQEPGRRDQALHRRRQEGRRAGRGRLPASRRTST